MPMSLPMKQALLVLLPLAANLAMTACNGVLFDCNNRLVASVDSPDKSIKAVVFERTCGATTGFNQQVALMKVYPLPLPFNPGKESCGNKCKPCPPPTLAS